MDCDASRGVYGWMFKGTALIIKTMPDAPSCTVLAGPSSMCATADDRAVHSIILTRLNAPYSRSHPGATSRKLTTCTCTCHTADSTCTYTPSKASHVGKLLTQIGTGLLGAPPASVGAGTRTAMGPGGSVDADITAGCTHGQALTLPWRWLQLACPRTCDSSLQYDSGLKQAKDHHGGTAKNARVSAPTSRTSVACTQTHVNTKQRVSGLSTMMASTQAAT